jgi:cell division transport system ATP-binding protein
MIRLINASKVYPNSQTALANINLHIREGEMAFLTGHSGAGKSTVLKLIMAIEHLSRGQLVIDGKNIEQIHKRHVPQLRQKIGMIFQSPHLLQNKTIFDNVALPLSLSGFKPYEVNRRTRAALDKVGLLKKEHNYPRELSSGEQQRIGIARAIVTKPAILLADEPTGNLDPSLSQEIMDLFCAFNDVGVTTLIATHDISLVERMNKRIIKLHNGQVESAQHVD